MSDILGVEGIFSSTLIIGEITRLKSFGGPIMLYFRTDRERDLIAKEACRLSWASLVALL